MKDWGFIGFIILGLFFIVLVGGMSYEIHKDFTLNLENQEKAEECEFLPGCERTKCLVDVWDSKDTKLDYANCLLEQIAEKEVIK